MAPICLRWFRFVSIGVVFVFGAVGCAGNHASGVAHTMPTSHVGRVRHVVLFKFKDDAPPAEIEKVERAFAQLKDKIPQIRDFEWGTDISPEGLQGGLTHCFLVTFDTPADRDAYIPHPAHQEFVALLKPLLDKATVVDYVAKATR